MVTSNHPKAMLSVEETNEGVEDGNEEAVKRLRVGLCEGDGKGLQGGVVVFSCEFEFTLVFFRGGVSLGGLGES